MDYEQGHFLNNLTELKPEGKLHQKTVSTILTVKCGRTNCKLYAYLVFIRHQRNFRDIDYRLIQAKGEPF